MKGQLLDGARKAERKLEADKQALEVALVEQKRKVDELQKKEQASATMAAMLRDEATEKATRHAKEKEAWSHTKEAEKQHVAQVAKEAMGEVQRDRELEMVRKDKDALCYIPEERRTNEIYEAAVQNDTYALEYVPDVRLVFVMTDKFCEAATKQCESIKEYVNKKQHVVYRLMSKLKDCVLLEMVRKDG